VHTALAAGGRGGLLGGSALFRRPDPGRQIVQVGEIGKPLLLRWAGQRFCLSPTCMTHQTKFGLKAGVLSLSLVCLESCRGNEHQVDSV